MKTFEYRIYKEVYDDIISGKKRIEYRLLNEKSSKIKKDDIILFRVLDSDKTLDVIVTNIHLYNTIDELYDDITNTSNNLLNYTKEEFSKMFYNIFGRENVMNSKIVGIEFKL